MTRPGQWRGRLGVPLRSPRFAMLAGFANVSIVNYAFGIASGWLLIPGDFGLLAFAQTVLLIAGLVLTSGFSSSLARDLATATGARRGALVRGALLANLALALAMSIALVALFAYGPLRSGFETGVVAALVALTFPALAVSAITRAAAQGSERFGAMTAIAVLEVAGKALVGVALMLAGFGAAGAVAGFLCGAIASDLWGGVILVRRLDIQLWGAVEWPALGVAGEQFGARLGLALLLNLDVVAVKLFAGADRAITGHYQAGIILANTPYYLGSALLPILFTRLAHLDRVASTAPAIGAALRLALLVLLPCELVLCAAPDLALGALFPRPYVVGAPALRLLALGNGAIILVAILATAYQATGKARGAAGPMLAVAGCEAFALRALVPAGHAEVAAALFLTAATTALVLLGLAYLRGLDRRVIRRTAVWFLRYIAALTGGILGGVVGLAMGGSVALAVGLGGLGYLGAALSLRLFPLPWLLAPVPPVPIAYQPSIGGEAVYRTSIGGDE